MKKAEYMEDHVGETFDAVVSSVMKFGLFVETFQKQLQEMYAMDERMKDVQANAGIAQCEAGTPLDKLTFQSSAARADAAKQGAGTCVVAQQNAGDD